MALKTKVNEVKHLVLGGKASDLDKAVADLLNDGWDLNEVRFLRHDQHNDVLIVFYVFVRTVKADA